MNRPEPGSIPDVSQTVPEIVFSCENEIWTINASSIVKIPLISFLSTLKYFRNKIKYSAPSIKFKYVKFKSFFFNKFQVYLSI